MTDERFYDAVTGRGVSLNGVQRQEFVGRYNGKPGVPVKISGCKHFVFSVRYNDG